MPLKHIAKLRRNLIPCNLFRIFNLILLTSRTCRLLIVNVALPATSNLHPLGDHVKNIRVTLQSSNSFVPAYAILDNLTYGEPMSGITECETDFAASEIKEGEVYAVDGTLRLTLGESGRLFSNEELSQLNSGIYIIRYMLTDGRTVTIKQMVR